MSVYKRKGSPYWYTRFQVGTEEINRSTGTADKEKAEQYEAKFKRDLWAERRLKEKPTRLWEEAVSSWLRVKQTKRSLDDDLLKLTWLKQFFNGRQLVDIDLDLIEEVLDKLDHSNATRNRYYSVIRGVFKEAQRRQWVQVIPLITLRDEPQKTPRYLTGEEVADLIEALNQQPRSRHLRDMVLFSLETGLRENNVTQLLWKQINLPKRFAVVTLEDAKGKRTLRVPLNSRAMAVLESRSGIHPHYVFSYRGMPVQKANRDGYQAALRAAGLKKDGINWHTLRHTWASWHVMNGTPLVVLQKLGGWRNLDMVMRYAHLAPDFEDLYIENSVQKLLHCPTEDEVQNIGKPLI